MGAESGSTNPAVILDEEAQAKYAEIAKLLRTVPFEFQFFQAVRLLERLHPNRSPVGRYVQPSREIARFGAHASMPFPASQIQAIEWPESAAPFVVVNFMGLTGPQGLLPIYYTELLVQRLRAKDTAMRVFFDMFNHRMISLFYQAWEKYRFTIAYERGERDRFSHYLMDLIGLGTKGLQKRQTVQDDSLLFYAGLLALHPRSSTALKQILWDYFDVPVEIEQYVGAWYSLDEQTQCKFDKANTFSEQMGVGVIVGDEIWDQQSGIRIRLGPLSFDQYLEFLPTGSAHEPLKAITKFFASGEFDFQVQLVLKREEVPACELGAPGAMPLLGWTTWSKNRPMGYDPGDTILKI